MTTDNKLKNEAETRYLRPFGYDVKLPHHCITADQVERFSSGLSELTNKHAILYGERWEWSPIQKVWILPTEDFSRYTAAELRRRFESALP